MKTTTALLLALKGLGAEALKESISNRPALTGGVCLSSLLFSASKPPLCSLGHEHPIIEQDAPFSEKVLADVDTESPWAPSTSCYHNATIDMEFCVYVAPAFANGKGVAIITDKLRAAHIERAVAGYMPDDLQDLQPLIHDITQKPVNTLHPKFKVVPMEGKDFGAVATGPIARGEIIIQESVSMLIDYAAFSRVPRPQMLQLQKAAIDALPVAHRARFLDMSAGHEGRTADVATQVERVLVVNSFDVSMDDDIRDDDFYASFVETARMNHDCRPNVDYRFDPKTLTQRTAAIRDIAEGEELTLSYINTMQHRAGRQRRLSHIWHFDCTCSLCSMPAPQVAASDERITQIRELREELADYRPSSRATPQMAELLISLYEQERAWGTLAEAFTLAAIEWNGVGEAWTATKFARLAIEHGLATNWEESGDVKQMKKLAADPWSHWSWMLRTRKRMGWGDRDEEE